MNNKTSMHVSTASTAVQFSAAITSLSIGMLTPDCIYAMGFAQWLLQYTTRVGSFAYRQADVLWTALVAKQVRTPQFLTTSACVYRP